MSSTLNDFLSGLNPTIAKQFHSARDTKTIRLPLASHGLTKALNGGIVKGRFTLLYGNSMAGKSAVMMQSIAKWQKEGLVCCYVDVEKTWDNDWASRLGVDVDELILIQKTNVTRIHDEVAPLLQAGIDVVVVDSVSMMLPDGFTNDDGVPKSLQDQRQIGAKAKAITGMILSWHAMLEDTALVAISQTTTEFGQTYTKQIPDGGKKMIFAASQIIKLSSSNTEAKQIKGDLKVGDKIIQQPIGRKVEGLIEKNKLGPQHRTFAYDLYYDGPSVGIDYVGEVVDEAIKFGIITKAAAWFKIFGEEDRKFQGRDKLIRHIKETSGVLDELKDALAKAYEGDDDEVV